MSGGALAASDTHPLRAFTSELLLARRRARLDALEASMSAKPEYDHDTPGPA